MTAKKQVIFFSFILCWDRDEKCYTDEIRLLKQEILFLIKKGKIPKLPNNEWIPEMMRAEAIVVPKDIKANKALVKINGYSQLPLEIIDKPNFYEENKELLDSQGKKISFSFEVEEGSEFEAKENYIFVMHVGMTKKSPEIFRRFFLNRRA